MTVALSVDRVVVGAAHAPNNSAATTRSAQLSVRAAREARQRMPRGAPSTKGGIAIIPVESPRRNRKADADYADSAVALRAIAETANCVARRFKGSEPLEAFQRLRGERLSTTLTP